MDIGRVRTGLAVSDPQQSVALPLRSLATAELLQGSRTFQKILADYSDVSLLVGLPVSLDGEEHAQAAWVRQTAESLATRYHLPLLFQDERRSTSQAAEILHATGHTARSMRSQIDAVAASIILQSYLDSLRRKKEF